MKYLIFVFLFILVGCTQPVLLIPHVIGKVENEKVNVLIMPFIDKTGQYPERFLIEKMVSENITKNFKGLIENPYKKGSEGYRIRKIPNPYVVSYIDSLPINQATIDSISPDIIVKGEIEQFYYGSPNKSLIGNFAAFGLIGLAFAEHNNKTKAMSIIGVRLHFLEAKTNKEIYKGVFVSKTGLYPIIDYDIEKALKDVTICVANNEQIAEIFSFSTMVKIKK